MRNDAIKTTTIEVVGYLDIADNDSTSIELLEDGSTVSLGRILKELNGEFIKITVKNNKQIEME